MKRILTIIAVVVIIASAGGFSTPVQAPTNTPIPTVFPPARYQRIQSRNREYLKQFSTIKTRHLHQRPNRRYSPAVDLFPL